MPNQPLTPEYARWAREVGQYASRVLTPLVGEVREEIQAIFDAVQGHLETSEVMHQRLPTMRLRRANSALLEVTEAIATLRDDYDIRDTVPLEIIEQELRAWVQEQGRGHTPGGLAPV